MENIQTLIAQYPLVEDLVALKETTWFNPGTSSLAEGLPYVGLTEHDVQDAHARLTRFAPYLAQAFPETAATGGIIESELAAIPAMQKRLEKEYGQPIRGAILLKKDSHLPISGSIKARGGIYEVLTHAEKLALEAGLLTTQDDYSILLSPEFKQFFSQYSIAVGSTGNLGMSIGIMSARIGFKVTVHMSADARAWKKAKLRSHGVTVVEYEEDYGVAVEQGRKAAESDPNCFFIDDENSRTLFLGYAVAGQRLKAQFAQQGRVVDADHPLFVYLPCGVGGGPGGVAFGLKLAFGDNVHCFFAEPTHSPCMLLGIYTGLHDTISVQDIGIDNLTAADGWRWAARPALLAGRWNACSTVCTPSTIRRCTTCWAGWRRKKGFVLSRRRWPGWLVRSTFVPPRITSRCTASAQSSSITPPIWYGRPAAVWCRKPKWRSTWRKGAKPRSSQAASPLLRDAALSQLCHLSRHCGIAGQSVLPRVTLHSPASPALKRRRYTPVYLVPLR